MSDTIALKETAASYVSQPTHPFAFEIAIPSSFKWLTRFDAEERAMFYQELLQAVAQAVGIGQWDDVAELIEDWRLTAEERADETLQTRLEDARREFATGGGHDWESVKREANLDL